MPSATARKLAPRQPARPNILRMGLRLAAGVSVARTAAAEGLSEPELDTLLAEPGFAELMQACRELRAMGEEERLERLRGIALDILEVSLVDGDPRTAIFMLVELQQGRNPVLTLARAAIRAAEREARVPPLPPVPPPPRLPPCDPPDIRRSAGATAARLGRALLVEQALHQRSEAAASQDAAPAEAAASPAEAKLPGPRMAARPISRRGGPSVVRATAAGETGAARSLPRCPRSPQGP